MRDVESGNTKVLVELKPHVLNSPKTVTQLMGTVLQDCEEVKGLLGVFSGHVDDETLEDLRDLNEHLRLLRL